MKAEKWPLADLKTPLLRENWYMAGYADEFDDGLHERTILGEKLVIYRSADGSLVAHQNRCPHRSFPLAEGILEEDGIRCRYHGAKFDSTGKLIDVPSMAGCPRITLRTYPMRTSGPVAWIWMGEHEPGALPDTNWFGDGWTHVTGTYPLKANWLLLAENLMDLTHLPYLHAGTLYFSRDFAEMPVKLDVGENSLTYTRYSPPNYQRSPFLGATLPDRIEEAGFRSYSSVDFMSPALTVGGGRFEIERPEIAGQGFFCWQIANFITPLSQTETRYWYFHARNFALDDASLSETTLRMVNAAFEEDRFAIDQVQRMHDEDPRPFREVHFKSDGPSVAMRRLVASMAKREAADAPDPVSEQELVTA